MRHDSDLEAKRRRDFDDLQNESAGRETGRIRRFLTRDDQALEAIRKKRAQEALRSLLEILLDDPLYRAKFEAASEAVTHAMTAVERALADLMRRIEAQEHVLAEMGKRAARLPDGTRVYRDAKGVVRRADGSIVDDTLAATILWTGGEPSFAERRQAQERLDLLRAEQDTVTTYRDDVLGPAKDRLNDPDNPPSLEELDRILQNVADRMPDSVRDQQASPEEAADRSVKPTAITLPTLTD